MKSLIRFFIGLALLFSIAIMCSQIRAYDIMVELQGNYSISNDNVKHPMEIYNIQTMSFPKGFYWIILIGIIVLAITLYNKIFDEPEKNEKPKYQPPKNPVNVRVDEASKEEKNVKTEYCPNGCGELKEWEGKSRCWKCGWPDK